MRINEKLLDEMAELEVDALLEGLKDPEKRTNPAFLDKVRKFLKDNGLQTSPETSLPLVKQTTEEIPVFEDVAIDLYRRAN